MPSSVAGRTASAYKVRPIGLSLTAHFLPSIHHTLAPSTISSQANPNVITIRLMSRAGEFRRQLKVDAAAVDASFHTQLIVRL
ncbi:hypothetical protein JYU34_001518 [Plutella xylostella]|uniref:Uncharacterized protein n=1 Tax=Plutella xylostella TaxID=51655 RepID=A0ABQ7R443_PLUXY|nr:hypothetical protein JYU34_001518 [Plutella xylostella]